MSWLASLWQVVSFPTTSYNGRSQSRLFQYVPEILLENQTRTKMDTTIYAVPLVIFILVLIAVVSLYGRRRNGPTYRRHYSQNKHVTSTSRQEWPRPEANYTSYRTRLAPARLDTMRYTTSEGISDLERGRVEEVLPKYPGRGDTVHHDGPVDGRNVASETINQVVNTATPERPPPAYQP